MKHALILLWGDFSLKKILGLLGALTLILNSWAQDTAGSEVKIPLNKYLELIEKQKTQPITVIEETALKGDYRTSTFQITFKGQAVSPWKKENVLANFEGHLRACSGAGIISYESGRYSLLPQKNNFQVTCKLQPKHKNLKLQVLNALYFESQVANAETNMNEENTENRLVTLLEKSKDAEQKPRADIVAKATYKLSILPDTSKFEYQFTVNNPNRLSEKYSLNLSNNEVIERIATDLRYQEAGAALNFTIPTGEHTVFITGKLNGDTFKPLLKSEEQYLLIQNHPLMQVQPTTTWRRIATHETAITQNYNSARAFLIDPRESLSWSAKKLEVFAALGYTLKNADYLYYVPRNGQAIVEATYQVANQGTPEIALAIPGKALYVSVDGAATPLYKDDKGQLLLSMTSGDHTVVVQYQPDMPSRMLATVASTQLVKPNAVISESRLTLRHDPAWSLVAGKFGDDLVSKIRLSSLFFAFFMGALLFFALKKLYNLQNNKLLLSIVAPAAALTLFGSFYTSIIFCALAALSVWRFRIRILELFKKVSSFQFSYKKAGFALAALFIVMFFVTQINFGGNNNYARNYEVSGGPRSPSAPQQMEAYDSAAASGGAAESLMANVMSKSKNAAALFSGRAEGKLATPTELGASENYEGLPAKIEIPNHGVNTYFNLSLLSADRDLKMSSFFVKSYFLMFIDLILALGLAFALYKNRKTLLEALFKSHA